MKHTDLLMLLTFGLLAFFTAAGQAATITTFTGGDTGEGLDLEGEFYLAVNAGGANGTWQFANGSTTLTFVNEATAAAAGKWSTDGPTTYSAMVPNYPDPDTTNDDNLEAILTTGRFDNSGGADEDSTFSISVTALTVGQAYQLQLLWHEPSQQSIGSRKFDVSIEGALVADDLDLVALSSKPGNGVGVVLTDTFTPTAGNTSLDVAFSYVGDYPFISAVTLEAVPEPSMWLLLATMGIVSTIAWQRKPLLASV